MALFKTERHQVETSDMCATDGCYNPKSIFVEKDGWGVREVCSDCSTEMINVIGWKSLWRIPSSRFL